MPWNIEKCIRGCRNKPSGQARSRYLAWTTEIGPDVCPYFYESQQALRLTGKRKNDPNQTNQDPWRGAREPVARTAEMWGWTEKELGVWETQDGILKLGEVGKATHPTRILIVKSTALCFS